MAQRVYEHQCIRRVSHDTWHSGRCSREGTVEREGLWYCKQHDPVAIKAKDDARYASWKAEWDLMKSRSERATAEQAACAGVSTEQLQPDMLAKMLEDRRWRNFLEERPEVGSEFIAWIDKYLKLGWKPQLGFDICKLEIIADAEFVRGADLSVMVSELPEKPWTLLWIPLPEMPLPPSSV